MWRNKVQKCGFIIRISVFLKNVKEMFGRPSYDLHTSLGYGQNCKKATKILQQNTPVDKKKEGKSCFITEQEQKALNMACNLKGVMGDTVLV